jgi:GNAT superfamily N-acetyltransferase
MTVAPVEDERRAYELARIINAAYAIGESGLWLDGTERIDEATVAGHIRAGEMLGATLDGRIAGCARVHPLDPATGEVGLVSTDPDAWGHGIGGALVAAAEDRMRARGATTMQLQVLTPRERAHPGKVRLRDWYERLGYRFARTEPFAAPALTTPCEFEIFLKRL